MHLWCRLILGLHLVVVCLTGTIVVYKKELERLAIPELVHVQATGPRGSFAEMVRLVKERYPDQRLVNAYSLPGTRRQLVVPITGHRRTRAGVRDPSGTSDTDRLAPRRRRSVGPVRVWVS